MVYERVSKKANMDPSKVFCSLLDECTEVEANPIRDSEVIFWNSPCLASQFV